MALRPLTLAALASIVSRHDKDIEALRLENIHLKAENESLWNEIYRLKGPRFPIEIYERFIDFLHNEHKALCMCALVCRNWLPASRLHLFEKLYCHAMFWFDKGPPLVPLLESQLCTIFPFVQELTFNASVDDGSSRGHPNNPDWLDGFEQHLQRFTGVTRMKLLYLSSHTLNKLLSVPCLLGQVINLTLYRVNFQEFQDLQTFLSFFPHLALLEYQVTISPWGPSWSAEEDFTPTLAHALHGPPPPPPGTLRELIIHEHNSEDNPLLYSWFIASQLRCLHTIKLPPFEEESSDQMAILKDLLNTVGTLRHTSIGFIDEYAVHQFVQTAFLKGCIALETVVINVNVQWLPLLLVTLPSSIINMEIVTTEKLEQGSSLGGDLGNVDRILSGTGFPVLKTFAIKVYNVQIMHGEEDPTSFIESKMPQIRGRGVLDVRVV